MNLTPVENYLEAIYFGNPDYMPTYEEKIYHGIDLGVNAKQGGGPGKWTDEWQVGWVREMADTAPFPKKNPLPDITAVEDYVFPDPVALFGDSKAIKKEIQDAKDRGLLVIGAQGHLLYERIWAIMGMENFLMALPSEPEYVHCLLHRLAEYARGVFDIFMELGVDAIGFSEDLGTQRSLMFSPEHFVEFFLPEYKYAFEHVLRAKKIVSFHSCGCVNSIAGYLADIGVTVLNPIQSRANDLDYIKEVTFGKTALAGGVDSHLLMTGTPGEVAAETERIIGILKKGGGYICGPDQHFPEYPEENIKALFRTATALGKY